MLTTSLILAVLSSPRLNVEVDNKECVIKVIEYSYIHSYVHMIGNCSYIYEKCIQDNCTIKDIKEEDLNFGKKTIG